MWRGVVINLHPPILYINDSHSKTTRQISASLSPAYGLLLAIEPEWTAFPWVLAGLLMQAFTTAIDCMDAMRNCQDAGDQSDVLNCMLYIEQYNLESWGRRCGLTEGSLSQSMLRQEAQALGLMIIRRILQTITQTEKLRQKYGMTIQPTKTVDTSAKTQRSFGSLVRAQLRYLHLTTAALSK